MADETQRLEYDRAEVRPPASRLATLTVVAAAVFVAVSLLAVLVVESYHGSRATVVGLWVVAGLAAGAMVWRVRRREKRGRREDGRAGATVLFVVGLVVGGLGVVPGMFPHYPTNVAKTVMCASNMKQIGNAILLYSNDNQGRYPDRLEQLLLTQDISASRFVCPGTDDVASQGVTVQAVAEGLTAGGHLSYVYVGAGLTNQSDPDTVVLYEPLSNHMVDGMNVLFGDGHVDFVRGAAAREIVDRAASGERPLVWKGPGVRAGPTTMGR